MKRMPILDLMHNEYARPTKEKAVENKTFLCCHGIFRKITTRDSIYRRYTVANPLKHWPAQSNQLPGWAEMLIISRTLTDNYGGARTHVIE